MPETDSKSARPEGARDALTAHHDRLRDVHMAAMFDADPERASRYCIELDGLLADYSKHRITDETLSLLLQLAGESGLPRRIADLFGGSIVNTSENRPALHTALRAPCDAGLTVDGTNITALVHEELDRVLEYCERLRGWSGDGDLETVVNIGIGGSDLGPRLAVDALHEHWSSKLRVDFVANMDGRDLVRVLAQCDPASTMFIVASKSFTTAETRLNAESARRWLESSGCSDAGERFIAVTANPDAAASLGISAERTFRIRDWVGGRYSVWSAVGLPLALKIGAAGFREFLAGGHAMDRHFAEAPLERNLPVVLGLLDVWYADFFSAETHAVIPYDQRLRLLPEYLGQLIMESNGKRTTAGGAPTGGTTVPVFWGGTGTNAQHAFFQMLHQGTHLVPIDFLASVRAGDNPRQHRHLLSNCLAQGQALMTGRADPSAPHRDLPGNQPSTTLLYRDLDPRTLGMLIALYEHRTFVQATLWGINPFDQWGVELGKEMARELAAELEDGTPAAHDPSTTRLLDYIRRHQ